MSLFLIENSMILFSIIIFYLLNGKKERESNTLPNARGSRNHNHNGRTYACLYRSGHSIVIVHKRTFFANGAARQTGKTLRWRYSSHTAIALYPLPEILSNNITARCTASGMETECLFQWNFNKLWEAARQKNGSWKNNLWCCKSGVASFQRKKPLVQLWK